MIPETLLEFHTYNTWAHDRLMTAAEACTDEMLDRPFEMGEGTLRLTLQHMAGAEQVWLDRWRGIPFQEVELPGTIPAIRDALRKTADERLAWMQAQQDFTQVFHYVRHWDNQAFSMAFDVSILHILNHGPHHRAQAVNMLKRMDVKTDSLDYIRMRSTPDPVPLDVATLRRYWTYGDWATRVLFDTGRPLGDAVLQHPHPLGPGSLGKLLSHLADAPGWWVDNLEQGPGNPFPTPQEHEGWDDLARRYQQQSARLRALLDTTDLATPVRVASPRGERSFPFGVVVLQVCIHGTHHRAQALNMLRHEGAELPSLDLARWSREGNRVTA